MAAHARDLDCFSHAHNRTRVGGEVFRESGWHQLSRPERRLPQWKLELSALRKKAVAKLLSEQDGGCASCGIVLDCRVYDIDHVFQDGAEDRRRRSLKQIYAGIARDGIRSEGRYFFALCLNCHRKKNLAPGLFCSEIADSLPTGELERWSAVESWAAADLHVMQFGRIDELPPLRAFHVVKAMIEAGSADPLLIAARLLEPRERRRLVVVMTWCRAAWRLAS